MGGWKRASVAGWFRDGFREISQLKSSCSRWTRPSFVPGDVLATISSLGESQRSSIIIGPTCKGFVEPKARTAFAVALRENMRSSWTFEHRSAANRHAWNGAGRLLPGCAKSPIANQRWFFCSGVEGRSGGGSQ